MKTSTRKFSLKNWGGKTLFAALMMLGNTAHAATAAHPYLVITPAQWSADFLDALAKKVATQGGSKFYQIEWAGHQYDSLLPAHNWSMTQIDPDTLRFELRRGDQIPFDINAKSGSERAEIGAVYDGMYDKPKGVGRVPVRTPVAIKYGMSIDPGPKNTASWLVLSQFHEDEVLGSPPVSICLDNNSDVMTVNIGYTNAAGKNVNGPIWKDKAPLVRGRHYEIAMFTVVDPNGQGRLVVYRDGVKIVDFNGTIGYKGQTNSFWKFGLYRHGPGTETIAERIDHMVFKWGANVKEADIKPLPLTLEPVAIGPFMDKSFRATVDGVTTKNAMVTLTVNGKLITSAPTKTGTFSWPQIKVPGNGDVVDVHIESQTFNYDLKKLETKATSDILLKAVNGKVVVAP